MHGKSCIFGVWQGRLKVLETIRLRTPLPTMPDLSLTLLITALTVAPFLVLYALVRFLAPRGVGRLLALERVWQPATLEEWTGRGWLATNGAEALPESLSPTAVFYEWAWADPEVARYWRFRETLREHTPVEALVRDAWRNLPEAAQAESRERLVAAVTDAATWWGGAERGWNRRPLSVPPTMLPKRADPTLPLLPLDDLTAAPTPGPFRAESLVIEGDGPDLVLALAALRQMTPHFFHPLAPRAGSTTSLVAGMSERVGSGVGARVGAGLGAALGPIGSMVGQYLGEMAGRMGAKQLTSQTLPEPLGSALRKTEASLSHLGGLAGGDSFSRALRAPEEAILATGKRVEVQREDRSRRLRERIWPTVGLILTTQVMRRALADLKAYRNAAGLVEKAMRSTPDVVSGGVLLQNPWLVRTLPEGPRRLTETRAALNAAASLLRER